LFVDIFGLSGVAMKETCAEIHNALERKLNKNVQLRIVFQFIQRGLTFEEMYDILSKHKGSKKIDD